MSEQLSKTIRKLIARSEKGDFSASFQLAQSYSEGFSVEKDKEKVQEYLLVCAKQLKGNSFKVKSIKLSNYKGFDHLDLDFNGKNSTILVGNNGSGKSSVLEAVQKSLTHLSSRLSTRSQNGDLIDDLEIKKGKEKASINTTFEVENQLVSMELNLGSSMGSTRPRGSYTEINDICQILRKANEIDPDLSLPLFASYTVERANDVTTKGIEESEEIKDEYIWDKSKAYSKSLSGKADFKLFFRWFKELIESDKDSSSVIDGLRVKIEAKEAEDRKSVV